MDFALTQEDRAYQEEVRGFLRAEPPATFPCQEEDEGYGFGAWSFEFNRRLGDKGWISHSWPTDCYGRGRPLTELFILFREIAYHNAPAEAFFYTQLASSALIKYASTELKSELLPPSSRGEITFWEGFSEPGAGSDLFALQTRAVEDGGDYLVTGQKVWNSNAHLARYGYTAARTDPEAPGHRGISLLVVDMRSPGVTVRPIDDLAGGQSFCEIFFDAVRVPKRHLVGEKNRGLLALLEGLEWDRFWGRCVKAPYLQRLLEELVQYCREAGGVHGRLADDPVVRHKLGEMAVEIQVCDLLFWRALDILNKKLAFTHEASIGKTYADELGQRFANVAMQVLGLYGQLNKDSRWVRLRGKILREFFCSFGHTLAGGTSEIQRNTIATRGLGLPRA